MKTDRKISLSFSVLLILAFALMALGCTPSYSYKENAVPNLVELNPRLQALFSKTKLVCFGRYAIEVPQEAELIMGSVGVPSMVELIDGGMESIKLRVAADIEKIHFDRNTAEIAYNDIGPVEESWQLRYYKSAFMKKYGTLFFKTYVSFGDVSFVFGGAIQETNDDEARAIARQVLIAKNLRLRGPNEVPKDPGFCVERAFVYGKSYTEQETASAGLYLPSFPDVTFSINSNKNAYGDYPHDQYELLKPKLSLLNRMESAKKAQGAGYPSRTLLREGKRDVQHWHGEESLFRRENDVHDFTWELVGIPRDVVNPSSLSVSMFTKVKHNIVGAAEKASLSDDEAVALWDQLLSGLKFRVKVPGAPDGSYFIDPDEPQAPLPAS